VPDNFYIILGISKNTDEDMIKSAYRKIINDCHPDKSDSPGDLKRFLAAREAYETLGDDKKRRDYDQSQAVLARKSRRSSAKTRETGGRSRPDKMRGVFSPYQDIIHMLFDGKRTSSDPLPEDYYIELILSSEEARRGGGF